MTTQKLPGSESARHGRGEADLTIMIAAHDAFRRDLVSLARAAQGPDRHRPDRPRPRGARDDLGRAGSCSRRRRRRRRG